MYEKYFHLSAKPFQLNPDPDFFYGSRGHRRAMAYLEYGLHQAEGFIVITGEVGAGKTTLVRNLLRRIPSETVSAAQIVSTQVDAGDLLRLVAAGFGVEHEGVEKSTLLTRLEAHFRGMHEAGRRALLVVDEAQNLAPLAVEELRMLSNFQVGTRSLVQSFLVGQPEFRGIMQRDEMRQLKQRIIASYHLGPLDATETRAYVEHRLRRVGWAQDPSFDDGAYEGIHAHTDGVPRRINALCDRLLLGAFLTEKHALTGADVDEVAAEIDEELGLTGGATTALPVPAPQASAGHAPTSQPAAHLSSPGSGPASQDGARVSADDLLSWPTPDAERRLSQLEDRVSLLEASASLTYAMLKKVIRGQQAAARKDGAPDA